MPRELLLIGEMIAAAEQAGTLVAGVELPGTAPCPAPALL